VVNFVSFAQTLARQTGREVRNKLRTHPELCLPLDQSHRDATDWAIEGKLGGLYSVGVGGALTGRPADVMIIDDPLRGRRRRLRHHPENLHEWWSSVARTRLAPGAPALIIQTRWHEDDLAGRMIEAGLAVGQHPRAGRRPHRGRAGSRARRVADLGAGPDRQGLGATRKRRR
jgi:hypothetical protein